MLVKHRSETADFEIDFVNLLASGESITGIDTIEVREQSRGAWSDVTSEFGALAASISGSKVQFTLNKTSTDGEQDGGPYVVFCSVNTDQGQLLAGSADLKVLVKGSVNV